MENFIQAIESLTGSVPVWAIFTIIITLSVWSIVWKGLALWKAARLQHQKWFIALLIVNTLGILEICYIYFVARKIEMGKGAPTATP